jgi:uncharacterized protein YuzE
MLIRHDTEADAKYITLVPEKARNGIVARTKKIHSWLLVDYDAQGEMFGVEILNASAHALEDVFEELFGDPDFGSELRSKSVRHVGKQTKSVKILRPRRASSRLSN